MSKSDVEAASPLLADSKTDVPESDVEALLYPSMQESPELRWAFIRKVYAILALQFLSTVAVTVMVSTLHSMARFFSCTWIGSRLYILLVILLLLFLLPLYIFRKSHPANFILLGVFTIGFGFAIGIASAFTTGLVFMEATVATMAVFICLTLYTFWAAKKGQDFKFLYPFMLTVLIVALLLALFQIFFPGKIVEVLVCGLISIVFCGFIILRTNDLIQRHQYDEYIWASVSLYLEVFNLFLQLLRTFRSANNR